MEPVLLLNGLSKAIAAATALLIASRFAKERNCILQRPLYTLSGLLGLMALLDLLWFFGYVGLADADNSMLLPVLNVALMAVWFYIALMISGRQHIYYLIPIFIMCINTFLVFGNLALLSDIMTGLMLVGIFFYIGFVEQHLVKKIGYTGMAYGALTALISFLAYNTGLPYVYSPWFVTDMLVVGILLLLRNKLHICSLSRERMPHHIPVVFEVLRFGLFIIGLSMFLMLGTLGMHEMGHSLAASMFGCGHDTQFGIGYAVTHVECPDGRGSSLITLGGFAITFIVALTIFLAGNDFARRMAFMLLAFAMLTSVDDFTALELPHSVIVIVVFVATLLIAYGIMLIVKEYEQEYDSQEALHESLLCEGNACNENM